MYYVILLINLSLFNPSGHTIQAAEWEATNYETGIKFLAECQNTLEYAEKIHNVSGNCIFVPFE